MKTTFNTAVLLVPFAKVRDGFSKAFAPSADTLVNLAYRQRLNGNHEAARQTLLKAIQPALLESEPRFAHFHLLPAIAINFALMGMKNDCMQAILAPKHKEGNARVAQAAAEKLILGLCGREPTASELDALTYLLKTSSELVFSTKDTYLQAKLLLSQKEPYYIMKRDVPGPELRLGSQPAFTKTRDLAMATKALDYVKGTSDSPEPEERFKHAADVALRHASKKEMRVIMMYLTYASKELAEKIIDYIDSRKPGTELSSLTALVNLTSVSCLHPIQTAFGEETPSKDGLENLQKHAAGNRAKNRQ